jgi:hypothetical protein
MQHEISRVYRRREVERILAEKETSGGLNLRHFSADRKNGSWIYCESMNLTVGTLEFNPVSEHPELLAPPVVAALRCSLGTDGVGVSEIDPSLADTTTFCERYNVRPDISANCVVLQAKRGGKVWFAACVILATSRADVNGAVRQILQARKVSFASMQEAVSLTRMEYGGITLDQKL